MEIRRHSKPQVCWKNCVFQTTLMLESLLHPVHEFWSCCPVPLGQHGQRAAVVSIIIMNGNIKNFRQSCQQVLILFFMENHTNLFS